MRVIWHGITRAAEADAYWDYLNRAGLPDYRASAGNRGVTVLRRIEGEVAHFTLISLWDSFDSIRKFAGDDIESARYYPGDTTFLLELEPRATHHQVLVER